MGLSSVEGVEGGLDSPKSGFKSYLWHLMAVVC